MHSLSSSRKFCNFARAFNFFIKLNSVSTARISGDSHFNSDILCSSINYYNSNSCKMSSSKATNGSGNHHHHKVISKHCQGRNLAIFDFDLTIISDNSDTVARDILPKEKFPNSMKKIVDEKGWTEYMAEVFRQLHANHIKSEKIRDVVRCIPETPGFVRLIKQLRQKYNFDVIVISDANSIFIEDWLRTHRLDDCIEAVFTNPAHFDENDLLNIEPYHHQTDCRLSGANLCKGKVMEHYLIKKDLRQNLRYEHIVYVGDGENDICPVLRLRPVDVAAARHGFTLAKHLENNRDKLKLRADVIVWKNGFDLLEQLQDALRLNQEKQN